MPGPAQLAWSISTWRAPSTRLTTATWPLDMPPLLRKAMTEPGSGRWPRS